jgi:hypothetical protein
VLPAVTDAAGAEAGGTGRRGGFGASHSQRIRTPSGQPGGEEESRLSIQRATQGTGSKPPRWNGDTSGAASRRALRRARGRVARSPAWRRRNRWAQNGRREAAAAKEAFVDVEQRVAALAGALIGDAVPTRRRVLPGHGLQVVRADLRKRGFRRGRTRVGPPGPVPGREPPLARGGRSRAGAAGPDCARPRCRRGAERRCRAGRFRSASRRFARRQKHLDESPGRAYPGGVALFEFPAFAEAVAAEKSPATAGPEFTPSVFCAPCADAPR